jgi:hypothetical protein
VRKLSAKTNGLAYYNLAAITAKYHKKIHSGKLQPCLQMGEMNSDGKRSNLLQYSNKYNNKKFYSTGSFAVL